MRDVHGTHHTTERPGRHSSIGISTGNPTRSPRRFCCLQQVPKQVRGVHGTRGAVRGLPPAVAAPLRAQHATHPQPQLLPRR